MPKVNVTTSIDMELHSFAKTNNIGWSDALEFGIKFIGADQSLLEEYPHCRLLVKLQNAMKTLEQTSQQLNGEIKNPSDEADEVFNSRAVDENK